MHAAGGLSYVRMAETSGYRELVEEQSSGSESETDREDFTRSPETKRTRKNCGAATYKTRFNSDWKKEFTFITSVPKDPYRYHTG